MMLGLKDALELLLRSCAELNFFLFVLLSLDTWNPNSYKTHMGSLMLIKTINIRQHLNR